MTFATSRIILLLFFFSVIVSLILIKAYLIDVKREKYRNSILADLKIESKEYNRYMEASYLYEKRKDLTISISYEQFLTHGFDLIAKENFTIND